MATTAAVAGQKLSATFLNNLRVGQLITASSQTTVANTTTETAIAAATIAANEAAVGNGYRIRAWGTLAVTGTPTITFRSRIGGAAGTTIITFPAVTVRSGATDGFWDARLESHILTTGSGGTLTTVFTYTHNFVTSVTTYTPVGPIISGSAAINTTISNDLVIDVIWGTASASNTLTCKGFTAERLV
jgi:hypothetical protein